MKTCTDARRVRLEHCGWRAFVSIAMPFMLLVLVLVYDGSLLDSAQSLLNERFTTPLYVTNETIQTTTAIATTISTTVTSSIASATDVAAGSALSTTPFGDPADAPISRPPMTPACDIYDGEWVYDERYPLYKNCNLAERNFQCRRRPDSSYQKWRWQPRQCEILMFDAEDMLARLRGKKVVFVGDSMGRTQWESFNCLLSQGVENKTSVKMVTGPIINKRAAHLQTRFMDHNVTVDYYRSPFLVRGGTDVPSRSPSRVRCTLKLKAMSKAVGKKLVDSDILVINTGHWWNHQKTYDAGCYFQVDGKLMLGMSVMEAYEKAVGTITSWMNDHINFTRTEVLFRSYEPAHYDLSAASVPYRSLKMRKDYLQTAILNRAVRRMHKPAMVLNITSLSAYRPDGHLYNWSTEEGSDHTHWCLPGVPDTWNELLYVALLLKGQGPWGARENEYGGLLHH